MTLKKATFKVSKTLKKFPIFKKRDGRVVLFDSNKIYGLFFGHLFSRMRKKWSSSRKISKKVIFNLEKSFSGKIPNVEEIQDTIINVLRNEDFSDVVDIYMNNTQKNDKRFVKQNIFFCITTLKQL